MSLVVRAKEHPTGLRKAVGYYDHKRRYPGDQFELEHQSHFSDTWMEKVGAKGSVAVGVDLKSKEK